MQIFELKQTSSTNDFLANQDYQDEPQLCVAQTQTGGKGQFGRVWQSGRKSALFSLKIKLPIFDTCGLSLLVGLSCVNVLEKYYNISDLSIKWPNDIFLHKRKLGGILIENQIKDNHQFLIIGIGINILNDSFVSLNQNVNTLQLAQRIAENILENLQIFQVSGLQQFHSLWNTYDFLTLNNIPIIFENTSGVASGVDKNGALIWQGDNKKVKIYSSNNIKVML